MLSSIALKRFLDPQIPIGRAGFAIASVSGFIAEHFLNYGLVPNDRASGLAKIIFVCGILGPYTILGVVTIKRLMDAGWSRLWVGLILSPVLLDLFVVCGNIYPDLKVLFYPLFGCFLAYVLMVVVLCVVEGQILN